MSSKVEGTFVRVSDDTYDVVFPKTRQGKYVRESVPNQLRDPSKKYCRCGRILRVTNRSGRCSICRDNARNPGKRQR